ncbi:VanZ family protein [Corynebacterium appendicis]|uniref:VanZ family protein n=1 Tax=Corynebacterium appendicis TaxID=163202 RepID=UPI002549F106|nr:VanZ family protein [Corynebacterium appendicis]MDK8626229.1 VanZ family protein [Corynebacterium appendicis]
MRARQRVTRGAATGALLAYSGVVIALTMLKQFFRIGYLWDPAKQPFVGYSFIPFHEIFTASSWFGPLFGYGGNLAFFIPVGLLLYVIFGRVKWATIVGGGFSLAIEVAQFFAQLGYTDVDDFIMNTVGAFVGATLARWCGPKMHRVWIGLTFAAVAVFIGLVLAGDSLGDPSRVKQL